MLTHRNMRQPTFEQAKAAYPPLFREGQELEKMALLLYHIRADGELPAVYDLAANLLITNPRDIPGPGERIGTPVHRRERVNTLFNALLNNEDFHKLDFHAAFLGRRRMSVKIGGREVRNHRQTPAGRLRPDGVRAAGGRATLTILTLQRQHRFAGAVDGTFGWWTTTAMTCRWASRAELGSKGRKLC